jgi:hypothetical protein
MKGKIIIQVPKEWTDKEKEQFSKDLGKATAKKMYSDSTIYIMSKMDVKVIDADTMDSLRK